MGERRICSTFNNKDVKEMSFEIIWGCRKKNITEEDFFLICRSRIEVIQEACAKLLDYEEWSHLFPYS